MKLLSRRRRDDTQDPTPAQPGAVAATGSGDEEDERSQVSLRGSTRIAFTRTQALGWGLRAALAAGPVALILILLAPSTPPAPPPVQEGPSDDPAAEAAVAGFAEDFVTTWLTTAEGQEPALDRFVADGSITTLPEVPWEVSWSSIVDLEKPAEGSDGTWSVTVAAAVSDEPEADQPSSVTRFFQVPVLLEDAAAVALTLPTPVAGPATGPEADGGGVGLGYEYRASLDEPVVSAAEDFAIALLTGSNDVSRYIAPDAPITAIDPSPYTGLQIDEALADVDLVAEQDLTEPATGDTVRLLLSGTATAGATRQISVQYALTMTGRDGRWEVSSIDDVPLVAQRSPEDDLAPSGSPSSDPAEGSDPSADPGAGDQQ